MIALDAVSPVLARFAAASCGSVLLGLALAALLRRALRRWPQLAAHRTTWLSAQLAVLLAFLLALAPLPRMGLAPALTLPAPAAAAQIAPHAAMAAATVTAGPAQDADDFADDGAHDAATLATRSLPWLAAGWLAVYAAGLLAVLARRLLATRRWRTLLRLQAQPLAASRLDAWAGATPEQMRRIERGGLAVRTTDLPLSPMLLGVLRPCLLLPAQLAAFDADQRRLIVEHELTHWRRRDPLWLAASSCIAALLWFNRPCRHLDAMLREAVELGCDDAVLAGRPVAERKGYAAALVAQLRQQHQQHNRSMAPAFGQLGIAARVARMREVRPARLSGRARFSLAGAALALAVATAGLQPALSTAAYVDAIAAPAMSTAAPAPLPAPAAPDWRYPLREARVTALYGVRSEHVPAGHHGIDFAARRGTPVFAVATGAVVDTGVDATLGNYVRIDHGGGRQSLMIHLDRVDVASGQSIAAGQRIGTAGASGKATGPHLHLEYWQDGRRGDPAPMFADLDQHATARALARRSLQGHPQPIDR